MNLFELYVKIGAEDKASPAMKNVQKNSETLTNKIKVMSAQFESAQKNVDELTKKFNESVQKTGATSKETKELAKKLTDAEKEAEKAKKALDDYNSELEETEEKAENAGNSLSKFSNKLGNGLKTAAKIGAAAVGVAATGIVALTKQSVESYAEFEQLVGGAELMFGNAFSTVMNNSRDAYKTVQMSQNEYLQQVNGFATGLKTALGGNEQAAADLAHNIIKAQADIVAATGNSQEAVQNAFNGIMKSNFTMLDNLQIGITPTKEGFQEVIDKVNEWKAATGEATNYQMGNLADMQSALIAYIEMVGMSGYAQAEAAGTISGSIAMTRAAWANLITGLADDNADIDSLMNNFVESFGIAAENLVPRIGIVLEGVGGLINEAIPVLMETIPPLIASFAPQLLSAGVGVVESILMGIINNQGNVGKGAAKTVDKLLDTIVDMLPLLVEAGISLIAQLLVGAVLAVPRLLALGPEIFNAIVDGLISVSEKIVQQGDNIVAWIQEGIERAWGGLASWFENLWQSLFGNRTINVNFNEEEEEEPDGSKANGLPYVPYDGYIAELHRGERVLTAIENKKYNSGNGKNGTFGDVNITVYGANYGTPRELAQAISEELQMLTERKAAVYA